MASAAKMTLRTKGVLLAAGTTLAVLLITDLAFLRIGKDVEGKYAARAAHWARECVRGLRSGGPGLLEDRLRRIKDGALAAEYLYLLGPGDIFLVHSDPRYAGRPYAEWLGPRPGVEEFRHPVSAPDGASYQAALGYAPAKVRAEEEVIRLQLRELMGPLAHANILIVLLMILISFLVSRGLIRPLDALAKAARAVGRGELKTVVPESSRTLELAVVQREFNAMACRLAELDDLKSEFLAKITHDLRSPLGAILAYTELLLMEKKGPLATKQKDALRIILDSVNYLSELINNILDMTKIEAGRMEFFPAPVDLPRTITETLALLRVKAAEFGLSLEAEASEGLPDALVDVQALKRILINLVSNAMKCTPAGGKITVQTSLAEDGKLHVTVRDTGIGIPPDKMHRLFSKFALIHRQEALPRQALGTGLGLRICKEIVEWHGGRIWVESEEGKGTAIHATFPPVPDLPDEEA